MDLYEGRDSYEWENQTTSGDIIQFACFPRDRPVILMKAYAVLKVPVKVAVECSIDFEARQFWDKTLYDFKVFHANEDKSVSRVSYTFRSPVPGMSDRDFYLQQLVRNDFPEPGVVAMHVSSLEASDEHPEQPNKVRAKTYLIGFILRPMIDKKTGQEHTEFFGCNSVDPCGMIPKWAINLSAKSVLPDWIRQYERGCLLYMEQQANNI